MPDITRRAAIATLAAAPLAAQRKRPNVLFLAVDDLNTRLGCYGAPVKSPNIDSLARAGVRFERAYCQYPLCNPTRSSLMSGRRPPTTRVWENSTWFRETIPDAITLPQHFRANGYTTAATGKIYHGGLDDNKAWDIGGTPLRKQAPRTPEENKQRIARADRWVALDGDGADQPDYRTADRAIQLLDQLKDKQFFLAVGFVKPHVPLIAPRKYFDLYDPDRLELPADFAPEPTCSLPSCRPNFDLFIGRQATPALARQALQAYYAATSFMDAQLGRVLAELDRLGLRDNTVISLYGDHGWHLGEKGMWSKQTLFEDAARAPMIVSAPGMSKGKSSPRTVEFLDLYPTLVDLCGLEAAPGVEGTSLRPLMRNPEAKWDRPAFTFIRRSGNVIGGSVRTEHFRYTEWNGGSKGAELYDYRADPREATNLATNSKYSSQIRSMKAMLAAVPNYSAG